MEDEQWFSKYPEIEKLYKLFGYEQLLKPLRYKYTPIPSYIQEGPQCGLVALAMIMQTATTDAVGSLYECARKANFTYCGEMFSVEEMCQLARMKLSNYVIEVYKGNLNCSFIKQFLLNGGFMLVPYDSSRNFSPCNGNGHQAHWAAISGCVECENNFYVLARQGKSKYVGMWDLKDLAESNEQLEEFSTERISSDYKLPDGGIQGPKGLKAQSVLLRQNHFTST